VLDLVKCVEGVSANLGSYCLTMSTKLSLRDLFDFLAHVIQSCR
jgi:hypothetical protein